ncbi:MAG: DUF1080 domain-containing protein [Candidatus Hydrogenedentes bacterium]|nr:DUF1080 domain-containing protein [Candidatus Hydrogenedentota bacterium]
MNLSRVALVAVFVCGAALAADWEDITPGGDLAGWTALGGQWSVADGVVRGTAAKDENTWLLFGGREFRDFEVELEFRTPVPTNGGLQFRSHWLPRPLKEGESAADAPKQMYGYQANVETRQRNGSGRLVDENGRGPLAEPSPESVKTLKQYEWNKMRVSARGGVIEVFLHDVSALRLEDEAYVGGFLALQSFAYEAKEDTAAVEYRNIRVKDYGREGKWRALFDGKSLAGWKEWGSEKWAVRDGEILGGSGPKKSEGYLATEETFKDFRVRGVFKTLGDGNFGLFYHSTITLKDDGYPVIAGLQGEVAPEYPSPSGWVYESYKRGWLVEPDLKSPQAMVLRPEQWNEIEIRTQGNHVTTWVNGMRVLDLTDQGQQLFEGSFALQLHSGGVDGILWKDLYVAE